MGAQVRIFAQARHTETPSLPLDYLPFPMTVSRIAFLLVLLSLASRVESQSASTVDGFQVRNSLFITQPLRSPAQASINVEMHEDIPRMAYMAKYNGIANQAERLKRDLESELKRMTIQASRP